MKNLLILFVFSLSSSLYAQNNLLDRIYYGGSGGLSIGSNQTNITVNPIVGYKITDNYSAGIGITYQYVKITRPISVSFNNFGWSIFNRYNITNQFFAYAEFERLTFEYLTSFSPERKAKNSYNSLLFGGGYNYQLKGNVSLSVTALYNVLYDASDLQSPYNSPLVLRFGVGVGIL